MQKRLFFLMAMLVTTLTMMAQVTTAGMGGKVTIEGTNETVIGATVTIGMAKAEGWVNKTGSKWQTMPELMLAYRAATFFARTHSCHLTNSRRSA